jgi:signal transduction histidine kinase
MRRVRVDGLAWIACGIIASLSAGTLALVALNHGGNCCPNVVGAVAGFIYAGVGALIVSRGQRVIGWSFEAAGFFVVIAVGSEEYLLRGLVYAPGSLPAVGMAAWLLKWVTTPAVSAVILVFLLFPTGRPRSRRWRPVVWLAIAGGVLEALGLMFEPGRVGGSFNGLGAHVLNPLGVPRLGGALAALRAVGWVILAAAGAGALLSLILRFWRSRGDEREQLRWLAYAPFVALLCSLVTPLAFRVGTVFGIFVFLFGLSAVVIGVPAAAAVAILKYHLYDIDVVINKTVVFGGLAAFITVVYVGIVVGIGSRFGQGDKPNVALSIVATAIVAVAFQLVRERVQRFANRLVYGTRATPYEVLSEFSSRMAGAYENEALLPRMARILGEGTGAGSTRVWLKAGDELRAEATWPASEDSPTLPMKDGALPPVPDASLVLPVLHRGDLLGALSLTKPPGERLTPTEEKLAADLASAAGLVLRNVRLTEELLARLEDLRASRERLVAAQDAERRRLERNIHDGAQQQLVALAIRARLARSLLTDNPTRAQVMLSEVEAEIAQALDDLRDLARGIYPPLLADRGLVVALDAQTRRASIPVELQAAGVSRYTQEAEAAVYFCALEALQNVAKYAGESRAVVRIAEHEGELTFEVQDTGAGFDPKARGYGTGLQGMADRLAALGGELQVRSEPGHGTTVTGHLPARAPEPVG